MKKGEVLKYGLMVKDKEYTLKQDWPKDVGLQCGDKGIVFNRKKRSARHTAFFEAFPLSKFVRGEGETLEKAEKACFEKARIIFECKHKNKVEKEGEKWSEVCSDCGAVFKFVNFKFEKCDISGENGAFLRKTKYINKKEVEYFYTPKSLKEREIKKLFNILLKTPEEINKESEIKEDSLEEINYNYVSDIEWACENIGFYSYAESLDVNLINKEMIDKMSNFRETNGPYSTIFPFYKILFNFFKEHFKIIGLPTDEERKGLILFRDEDAIKRSIFLLFAEKIRGDERFGEKFYEYLFNPLFEALSFFIGLYYENISAEKLERRVEAGFESTVSEVLKKWTTTLGQWGVNELEVSF